MSFFKHIFRQVSVFLVLLVLLPILSVPCSFAFASASADENGILDLSDCTNEEIASIISGIDADKVLEVNLIDSTGMSQVDLDTLDEISSAFPKARIKCSFELFGNIISSEDEVIEYDGVHIGNEGLSDIRAVLPYLTSCNYLLLADCDIDDELLAQLREDFPKKHIVWRIHTFNGKRACLTDITLFRTVAVNDNDAELLKYCNEVKYIDVGHTPLLSNISFVEYMPALEVLILVDTSVTDISVLSNCHNLEYLELFDTEIADLSPLAELENLQHLNIADMRNVTDISCLYNLTNLKRLRLNTSKNLDNYRIPREQIDTIARLLPDCDMQFGVGYALYNGWRFDCFDSWTDRYRLLREQMQYDLF